MLAEALKNLTAAEAAAVYDAIAQYVENGRDAVENECISAGDVAKLEAAEGVMARLDLAMAKLAASKYTVYAVNADEARVQFASHHPGLPILEVERVRSGTPSDKYLEYTVTA